MKGSPSPARYVGSRRQLARRAHVWNRVPVSTLDQAGLRGINRRTSASFRDFAKPFIG